MIFFTITWRVTLWSSRFLQILQVATKIGIDHRLFCGDNLPPKVSTNCPWTLLNSVTDDFMRVFWKSCAKIFVKLSEQRMRWRSLKSWTNKVYSLLPNCTIDTFRKCLKRKGNSKISKIPKKSLRNCPFFC